MKKYLKRFSPVCLVAALAASSFCMTGCEQKEKVLDVETPGGSLEVERSTETGNVDIEIDDN